MADYCKAVYQEGVPLRKGNYTLLLYSVNGIYLYKTRDWYSLSTSRNKEGRQNIEEL